MKRRWALLAPLFAAACGEEGPTEVGAGLLPPDALRTFEIILEPHQYMVFDTAFGLYSAPQDAAFLVVASEFDGALDSNSLMRFVLPRVVTVTDTLNVMQLDTMPRLVSGEVAVVVDTMASSGPPVRLALYRTAEPWDATATWIDRTIVDGVRTPWTVPGGRSAVLVDTATWVARTDTLATDTVRFRVDSVTLALWADTANASRGAMIVAETPGSRVRLGLPQLTVQAASSFRPDTTFQAFAPLTRRTFIFSPELPESAAEPRVGGTPAWRTIIRLRPGMDTLSVPCPGVPNCRIRLGDATINYAALRLQPVPPPAGFRPESDLHLGAYTMLPSELLPLQRSPLLDFIGGATVPASSFVAPDTPIVEMPITELLRRTTMRPEARPAGAIVPTHLALTRSINPQFGFGTFASMPQLRLVVTIMQELQLP